ncbi:hypothetical protein [Paenibacillus sp. NPDC058174]|uniref:hypothetical protein n=1 Tax=Paenibacillus sp. NPDC058174 TaxID=3346366 RepID=UPI0036D79BBC
MNKNKLYATGSITIPIYMEVSNTDSNAALTHAQTLLNNATIATLQGDLSTWDGKEYPILANRLRIEWYDVIDQEEII